MPKSVPTPVAAALGLVPTVLDGARRLPAKAVQLPVLAVSSALTALDAWKKEYDELAGRGERLVGRLRGGSFDRLEDKVEQRLQGTRLATPYDAVEDAVEDTVAKVSELLDRAAQNKPSLKAAVTPAPAVPDAEAPKGEPTPSAPSSTPERVDTAATPDVIETVEQVAAAVAAPPVTSHDELPLPDYDHMTLGSLRGRLRSLSLEQLVQVRDYEKAHANRLPVITLLDNRIAKLASDASATPSPGGAAPVLPAPSADGKVSKAAAPKKTASRTKVRTT
ncbi:MAG: hypothetical protein JWN55_2686 [Frankiales bacterium]|nr:hypothetical protein [Frankiales bacterium]